MRRPFRHCFAAGCSIWRRRQLKTCSACRHAFYCSREHQIEDREEHKQLCQELIRYCDFPDCGKIAARRTKCTMCKSTMYCTEEHRALHEAAHEVTCNKLQYFYELTTF
jgi:hypothetical protein